MPAAKMKSAPPEKAGIVTTLKMRVYTTPAGYARLGDVLEGERLLYNAALQERRDAYSYRVPAGVWYNRRGEMWLSYSYHTRPDPVRISKAAQNRSLTGIRADDPEGIGGYTRRISVGTLDRIDRAFQAFWRRRKAGEKCGYPRFRSASRFNTLEMTPDWVKYRGAEKLAPPQSGNGWFKTPRRIRIPGLPLLRFRQVIPEGAEILTARLTRKGRQWYASLSIRLNELDSAALRLPDTPAAVGIDMGITDRVATSDGEHHDGIQDNHRAARVAQRKMSRRTKGSRGWHAARRELATIREKDANRRQNSAHQISRKLVNRYGIIALEDLAVSRMTKSAAGTEEEPGRNVAAKSGLNREILSQGWAQLRSYLAYKAEWAGRQIVAVNPAYTSQTCSDCGSVNADNRKGKRFQCLDCGKTADADHNAAINVLRLALGQVRTGAAKPPGAHKQRNGVAAPRNPHQPFTSGIQGNLLL